MTDQSRAALFEFVRYSARLRQVGRHNDAEPGRRESVAEHSWHLALVSWLLHGEFEREFGTRLDLGRMIKMCLMHDLVEIDVGDHSAWQAGAEERDEIENAAASRMFATLPEDLAAEFLDLWRDYQAGTSLEARLVRGVDRLNPALMRYLTGQGWSAVGASAADLDALQMPRVGVSSVLTELYREVRDGAVAEGLLGTERSRTAAHDMFDDDRASRELGIELVEAGDGRAVARMRVTESMVNGHAIAHGGYLFLLADTAFALACNSHGPPTVASGAEITFVAPARLGDVLTARAEERTRYGRNGIYDVTVSRGDEVVAEFRGRSSVVRSSADRQR